MSSRDQKLFTNITRELIGVLCKDTFRYIPKLYFSGDNSSWVSLGSWIYLRNRYESLIGNPHGPGVICDWEFSSQLHACKIIPHWGKQLMRLALDDWPIEFSTTPKIKTAPTVSFIFAHAGLDRLPQLNQTIFSLWGQLDSCVECVVIDLTPDSVQEHLPEGVIYHHIPTNHLSPGWRKSWAYNIGARVASGDILVFHDGDICVPNRYVQELLKWLYFGDYQVASIQRFLFYLSAYETEKIIQTQSIVPTFADNILQNWQGGTIAIRKQDFFAIGGFDEGFVNWGGEDLEFFDRCRLLRHFSFGYLPFIHLFHQPQKDHRLITNLNTAKVLPARLRVKPSDRRDELVQRQFGNSEFPDPPVPYFIDFE